MIVQFYPSQLSTKIIMRGSVKETRFFDRLKIGLKEYNNICALCFTNKIKP